MEEIEREKREKLEKAAAEQRAYEKQKEQEAKWIKEDADFMKDW